MLTEEEKKYIILAVNSGLKEEFLLLSFLRQSSWPEEKQQAALSFFRDPSFKNNLEKENISDETEDVDLDSEIILDEKPDVKKEGIQEISDYINKIADSIEENSQAPKERFLTEREIDDIARELSEGDLNISERVIIPKSDFDKNTDSQKNREAIESFILSSTSNGDESKSVTEITSTSESDTIEDLADKIFSKNNEEVDILNTKIISQNIPTNQRVLEATIFENKSEDEDIKKGLINVTDHEGNPHSILDLVMIFSLIFIVIVMSVILFMYVQEVGPFAPIKYIKN